MCKHDRNDLIRGVESVAGIRAVTGHTANIHVPNVIGNSVNTQYTVTISHHYIGNTHRYGVNTKVCQLSRDKKLIKELQDLSNIANCHLDMIKVS